MNGLPSAGASVAARWPIAPLLPAAAGVSSPVGENPFAPGLHIPGQHPRHPTASTGAARPGVSGLRQAFDKLENSAALGALIFINRHERHSSRISKNKDRGGDHCRIALIFQNTGLCNIPGPDDLAADLENFLFFRPSFYPR